MRCVGVLLGIAIGSSARADVSGDLVAGGAIHHARLEEGIGPVVGVRGAFVPDAFGVAIAAHWSYVEHTADELHITAQRVRVTTSLVVVGVPHPQTELRIGAGLEHLRRRMVGDVPNTYCPSVDPHCPTSVFIDAASSDIGYALEASLGAYWPAGSLRIGGEITWAYGVVQQRESWQLGVLLAARFGR